MGVQKSQKKQHQDDIGDLHCQPAGVLGSAHLHQQDPRAVLDSWEGFWHHQFLCACCNSPPSGSVSCGCRNSRACSASPRKRVCSDPDQQGAVMLTEERVRNCVLLYREYEGGTWTGTNQPEQVRVKESVDPVPGSASHLGEVTLALSTQRQSGK